MRKSKVQKASGRFPEAFFIGFWYSAGDLLELSNLVFLLNA
jgi:hypothetical protein